MTGPQASYLETLCREAGRDFDPSLTKAQASKLIDELQQQTGRDKASGGPVGGGGPAAGGGGPLGGGPAGGGQGSSGGQGAGDSAGSSSA